jgi:hypothetical protein
VWIFIKQQRRKEYFLTRRDDDDERPKKKNERLGSFLLSQKFSRVGVGAFYDAWWCFWRL